MSNDKAVHVVYILTKLELGGAQKICISLFKGTKEKGSESTLITGSEGILVDEIKDYDSVYLIDSFKHEVGFKNIINEFKSFFQIIKLLRKLKKKNKNIIVHTHSTKAGIIGRVAAFFAGIKTRVHTVHGFGFNEYQSIIKWLFIYFSELATSLITTHFVCVSQKDIETGATLFPRFKNKVTLIRAAVEYEKFYIPAVRIKEKVEFINKENEFIFGTISCFKPQKNILDLLEAFKLVFQKNKKIKLQIIGDGVLRPILENWISKNNLENEILLLGWQNNVASIMKSWNCYVMSSLWEGLPCSIVEARLMKLPVIAYSVGGISEVVFNEQNGFLINPKDIKALAKRMEQISFDSNLEHQLSSFNDNLGSFNNFYMIEQHINLYKQLIK